MNVFEFRQTLAVGALELPGYVLASAPVGFDVQLRRDDAALPLALGAAVGP